MKKYLDLIPISEKIHGKQSRMTRLCIILAVFLISAIFGMADMEVRNQRAMALKDDGAWHVCFRGITEEQAKVIAASPEVRHASRYAATNYRLDKDYTIAGKKAGICGFDEDFLSLVPAAVILEGKFPTGVDEAVVTDNLRQQMEIQVGESIVLKMPGGEEKSYRITGIAETTSLMAQYDAIGLYINTESYGQTFLSNTESEDVEYYVEFKPLCNVQKTWKAICGRIGIPEDKVAQNAKILGLMLQSNDSYIMKLYLTAAALAILVVVSGILMIASSMNSSVAKRTEFFGMLRCLGATCRQVKRFVRREALNWCKTAIPTGLILSAAVTAVLCQILKVLSPSYFSGMSFGISIAGLASGTVIGIATVLLAANVPARKAAEVSPLTAVSGNAGTVQQVKRAAENHLHQVDISLGIHHAAGSGRTLFLMTGSFAFSIILFLSFVTTIDFAHHAVTSLRPYTPDVSVVSGNDTCSLPRELEEELKKNPAVKRIYGRSFAYSVPVHVGENERAMHIISYEENQFAWAEDALLTGSVKETEKEEGVLIEIQGDNAISVGEEVSIPTIKGQKNYPVTGILSYTPFQNEQGAIVCSEEIFHEITGEENYTILDMQLVRGASDEDVEQIRNTAESITDNWTFSDRRKSNQEARGAYYSFTLFVYGFLVVIVLIAVFNIINSIGMSVSARMTQFGTMRAIGMSDRQVIRMVTAEAVTYAFLGMAVGAAVGIPIHRALYQSMITSRWGDVWMLPVAALVIIAVVIIGSVFLAVVGPAKSIREMSVVDTIGAL